MILIQIIIWFVEMLVSVPLYVLGFPLCLIMAVLKKYSVQYSPYYDREIVRWNYKWMFIWDSPEDGVIGNVRWNVTHKNWPIWFRVFVWTAWRNPTNGLRFLSPFGFKINPAKVKFYSNCYDVDDFRTLPKKFILWSYAWQGLRSGFHAKIFVAETWHLNFRIGWKIKPRDVFGVQPED
jgi:hypothetical protein